MNRVVLAMTCLSLSACALGRSPSATTWVLDPVAARVAPAATSAETEVLSVERVRLPDWLDRPQLVVRAADGRLELDPQARWGEPLGRGLQRVIAENLASLMTSRHVVTAPAPPRSTVAVRLNLDFIDASRQSDGAVHVEVRWEFQATDGTSLRRGLSTHRIEAVKPGPPGVVAALNEALLRLATELAEALRGMPTR